jgi:hypothetical protein
MDGALGVGIVDTMVDGGACGGLRGGGEVLVDAPSGMAVALPSNACRSVGECRAAGEPCMRTKLISTASADIRGDGSGLSATYDVFSAI